MYNCIHKPMKIMMIAFIAAIHRGTFTSVPDLNAKIRAFIDG